MGKYIGKHLIAEFYGCDKNLLNNKKKLKKFLLIATQLSNSTILKDIFCSFKPYGVTGIIIVAESHLSIHTYPEFDYAAVDLFTCGEFASPEPAFYYLKEKLKAKKVKIKLIKRGKYKILKKEMKKYDKK